MQTFLIQICKWILRGFAIFFLLIGVLFFFAQTDAGKKQLARFLASALSRGPDLQIKLGKIEGIVPFDLELDHFSISDARGIWLASQGIVLRWSPTALLRGNLQILEFNVSSLELDRLPPKSQKKSKSKPSGWLKHFPPLILERLSIPRLTLGEKVAGERAVFAISSHMSVSHSPEKINGYLGIYRTDGPKARAEVTATIQGDFSLLDFRGTIHEQEGGLIAHTLGITGPFSASLKGKGPLQGWTGELSATAGSIGAVKGDVFFKTQPEYALTLQGNVKINPLLLPKEAFAFLDTENRFSIALALQQNKTLLIEGLTLNTSRGTFQLTGKMGMEDGLLSENFNLKIRDISPLGTSFGTRLSGELDIEGTISGSIKAPRSTLSLSLNNAEISEMRIGQIEGSLDLEFLEEVSSPFSGLRIKGKGSISNFNHIGYHSSLKKLHWTLNGDVSNKGLISLDAFQIKGSDISLTMAGSVDTKKALVLADAEVQLGDIRMIPGQWIKGVAGSAQMSTHLKTDWKRGHISGEINGKLRGFNVDRLPHVSEILHDFDYSAALDISLKNELRISNLRVSSKIAELTGKATLSLNSMESQGQWQFTMPNLEVLSKAIGGHPLGGSLFMQGEVSGTPSRLVLVAKATGRTLQLKGLSLESIQATLRADHLPFKPKGHIDIAVQRQEHSLNASTLFSLENEQLKFSDISMESPGTKVVGNINVHLQKKMLEGLLKGDSEDLSYISALLGESIGGSTELKAQFIPAETGQDIFFHADASNIVTPSGHSEKIELDAYIREGFTTPQGEAKLKITNHQSNGLKIEAAHIGLEKDEQDLRFETQAKGSQKEDFEVRTKGNLTILPQLQKLSFDTIQGHYGEYPISLSQPITIHRAPDGFTFDNIELSLGAGNLKASGNILLHELSFQAAFEDFPLETLRLIGYSQFSGLASGQLHMRGTLESPEADMALRFHDIRSSIIHGKNFPPLNLAVDAKMRNGLLSAILTLEGLSEEPAKADFQLPVKLSLSPLALLLEPNAEIQGRLMASGNLNRLSMFFPMDNHAFKGQLQTELNVAGSKDDLQVMGSGRIENGSYENKSIGTELSSMRGVFKVKGHRLILENASASDGRTRKVAGKGWLDSISEMITAKGRELVSDQENASDDKTGKVTAQGWIDLLPSQNFPFLLHLNFDKAGVISRDDIMGALDGTATLSGSLTDMLLKGKVTLAPAEINIPDKIIPGITELEVIEINMSEKEEEQLTATQTKKKRTLLLNLDIESPGRLFFRWRGLDSELKGALRIEGDLESPIFTGNLSSIRGHVNFFGKRLNLTKGTIAFNAAPLSSPFLDVTAQSSRDNVTAMVRLWGLPSNIQITLESDPPLPPDEILAHLIFGRSVANITPFQALRLAKAINALARGDISSSDFKDRTRRFLGVDELDITQSDSSNNDTAISIGKYLREDVYVDVEKGLGNAGDKVSIEVEITPSITLDSETSTNEQRGIGLNWKRDY